MRLTSFGDLLFVRKPGKRGKNQFLFPRFFFSTNLDQEKAEFLKHWCFQHWIGALKKEPFSFFLMMLEWDLNGKCHRKRKCFRQQIESNLLSCNKLQLIVSFIWENHKFFQDLSFPFLCYRQFFQLVFKTNLNQRIDDFNSLYHLTTLSTPLSQINLRKNRILHNLNLKTPEQKRNSPCWFPE